MPSCTATALRKEPAGLGRGGFSPPLFAWVEPQGDFATLARCMEFVLDEPEAVNRLRRAAKQRAEWLFPLEKMVAAHLELYRQICPKRDGCYQP